LNLSPFRRRNQKERVLNKLLGVGSAGVEVVGAEEEPRDRGRDLTPLIITRRRARKSKERSSQPREERSSTIGRSRMRTLTISSTTMDPDPSTRESL
jgi:hypothetical protein